jgi:ATP-dependent DNA ligase
LAFAYSRAHEALLVEELPDKAGWQFEPKWDGFRCLAFRKRQRPTQARP